MAHDSAAYLGCTRSRFIAAASTITIPYFHPAAAQLPLSMCANDACGGSLSSRVQSSQSLRSPILLLASRASFVASSLAALHALHPQNALLVAGRGPSFPVSFPPLEYACGVPRVAPRPVVSPWLPRSFWSSHCGPLRATSSNVARLSFPPFSSGNLILF